MIQSMTGYAAASADSPRGALSLELRSVNARFLDLQFRVAEELRALEPLLRERDRRARRARQGRLPLVLQRGAGARRAAARTGGARAPARRWATKRGRPFPEAGAAARRRRAALAGRRCRAAADEERCARSPAELCRRALDELVAARGREGAKLAASIGERVAAMRTPRGEGHAAVPQAVAAYQAKLAERLREALGSADDERVRTEVAVFAAKSDVDEELERLRAHLARGRARAQAGRRLPGKRLDFLAQELNREANTLASKAASPPIADCALELKLLIEQVREQVQNIE